MRTNSSTHQVLFQRFATTLWGAPCHRHYGTDDGGRARGTERPAEVVEEYSGGQPDARRHHHQSHSSTEQHRQFEQLDRVTSVPEGGRGSEQGRQRRSTSDITKEAIENEMRRRGNKYLPKNFHHLHYAKQNSRKGGWGNLKEMTDDDKSEVLHGAWRDENLRKQDALGDGGGGGGQQQKGNDHNTRGNDPDAAFRDNLLSTAESVTEVNAALQEEHKRVAQETAIPTLEISAGFYEELAKEVDGELDISGGKPQLVHSTTMSLGHRTTDDGTLQSPKSDEERAEELRGANRRFFADYYEEQGLISARESDLFIRTMLASPSAYFQVDPSIPLARFILKHQFEQKVAMCGAVKNEHIEMRRRKIREQRAAKTVEEYNNEEEEEGLGVEGGFYAGVPWMGDSYRLSLPAWHRELTPRKRQPNFANIGIGDSHHDDGVSLLGHHGGGGEKEEEHDGSMELHQDGVLRVDDGRLTDSSAVEALFQEGDDDDDGHHLKDRDEEIGEAGLSSDDSPVVTNDDGDMLQLMMRMRPSEEEMYTEAPERRTDSTDATIPEHLIDTERTVLSAPSSTEALRDVSDVIVDEEPAEDDDVNVFNLGPSISEITFLQKWVATGCLVDTSVLSLLLPIMLDLKDGQTVADAYATQSFDESALIADDIAARGDGEARSSWAAAATTTAGGSRKGRRGNHRARPPPLTGSLEHYRDLSGFSAMAREDAYKASTADVAAASGGLLPPPPLQLAIAAFHHKRTTGGRRPESRKNRSSSSSAAAAHHHPQEEEAAAAAEYHAHYYDLDTPTIKKNREKKSTTAATTATSTHSDEVVVGSQGEEEALLGVASAGGMSITPCVDVIHAAVTSQNRKYVRSLFNGKFDRVVCVPPCSGDGLRPRALLGESEVEAGNSSGKDGDDDDFASTSFVDMDLRATLNHFIEVVGNEVPKNHVWQVKNLLFAMDLMKATAAGDLLSSAPTTTPTGNETTELSLSKLVYGTSSMNPLENEAVVAAALTIANKNARDKYNRRMRKYQELLSAFEKEDEKLERASLIRGSDNHHHQSSASPPTTAEVDQLASEQLLEQLFCSPTSSTTSTPNDDGTTTTATTAAEKGINIADQHGGESLQREGIASTGRRLRMRSRPKPPYLVQYRVGDVPVDLSRALSSSTAAGEEKVEQRFVGGVSTWKTLQLDSGATHGSVVPNEDAARAGSSAGIEEKIHHLRTTGTIDWKSGITMEPELSDPKLRHEIASRCVRLLPHHTQRVLENNNKRRGGSGVDDDVSEVASSSRAADNGMFALVVEAVAFIPPQEEEAVVLAAKQETGGDHVGSPSCSGGGGGVDNHYCLVSPSDPNSALDELLERGQKNIKDLLEREEEGGGRGEGGQTALGGGTKEATSTSSSSMYLPENLRFCSKELLELLVTKLWNQEVSVAQQQQHSSSSSSSLTYASKLGRAVFPNVVMDYGVRPILASSSPSPSRSLRTSSPLSSSSSETEGRVGFLMYNHNLYNGGLLSPAIYPSFVAEWIRLHHGRRFPLLPPKRVIQVSMMLALVLSSLEEVPLRMLMNSAREFQQGVLLESMMVPRRNRPGEGSQEEEEEPFEQEMKAKRRQRNLARAFEPLYKEMHQLAEELFAEVEHLQPPVGDEGTESLLAMPCILQVVGPTQSTIPRHENAVAEEEEAEDFHPLLSWEIAHVRLGASIRCCSPTSFISSALLGTTTTTANGNAVDALAGGGAGGTTSSLGQSELCLTLRDPALAPLHVMSGGAAASHLTDVAADDKMMSSYDDQHRGRFLTLLQSSRGHDEQPPGDDDGNDRYGGGEDEDLSTSDLSSSSCLPAAACGIRDSLAYCARLRHLPYLPNDLSSMVYDVVGFFTAHQQQEEVKQQSGDEEEEGALHQEGKDAATTPSRSVAELPEYHEVDGEARWTDVAEFAGNDEDVDAKEAAAVVPENGGGIGGFSGGDLLYGGGGNGNSNDVTTIIADPLMDDDFDIHPPTTTTVADSTMNIQSNEDEEDGDDRKEASYHNGVVQTESTSTTSTKTGEDKRRSSVNDDATDILMGMLDQQQSEAQPVLDAAHDTTETKERDVLFDLMQEEESTCSSSAISAMNDDENGLLQRPGLLEKMEDDQLGRAGKSKSKKKKKTLSKETRRRILQEEGFVTGTRPRVGPRKGRHAQRSPDGEFGGRQHTQGHAAEEEGHGSLREQDQGQQQKEVEEKDDVMDNLLGELHAVRLRQQGKEHQRPLIERPKSDVAGPQNPRRGPSQETMTGEDFAFKAQREGAHDVDMVADGRYLRKPDHRPTNEDNVNPASYLQEQENRMLRKARGVLRKVDPFDVSTGSDDWVADRRRRRERGRGWRGRGGKDGN